MAQELLPTQKGQNRIEHEGYFFYKTNLKQTELLVMNVGYVGVASAVHASGLMVM